MTLSVAMITMNEEANLPRTLDSVRFAAEIVIVDSFSTDRTLDIARTYNAKIFVEPFKGHGGQKNSAIDKCTSDWILLLDADEVLSEALQQSILTLLHSAPPHNAYWVNRSNNIFGRWMKYGGLYPDRKLRLFRRGAARMTNEASPHSTPSHDGSTGKLSGDLLHYAYPTLQVYLEHMSRYSNEMAHLAVERGKTSRSPFSFCRNVVLNPIATFCYNYIVRLGFLDGREGLLLHIYHSIYVSWKYAKAWEMARNQQMNG
ncbi:MAG: glycosyltransferase family 2 protein [Acidobacteria bacterium]|nr:glycosyltransferase family 2 protein [Acidobacteriota bacterium]